MMMFEHEQNLTIPKLSWPNVRCTWESNIFVLCLGGEAIVNRWFFLLLHGSVRTVRHGNGVSSGRKGMEMTMLRVGFLYEYLSIAFGPDMHRRGGWLVKETNNGEWSRQGREIV